MFGVYGGLHPRYFSYCSVKVGPCQPRFGEHRASASKDLRPPSGGLSSALAPRTQNHPRRASCGRAAMPLVPSSQGPARPIPSFRGCSGQTRARLTTCRRRLLCPSRAEVHVSGSEDAPFANLICGSLSGSVATWWWFVTQRLSDLSTTCNPCLWPKKPL